MGLQMILNPGLDLYLNNTIVSNYLEEGMVVSFSYEKEAMVFNPVKFLDIAVHANACSVCSAKLFIIIFLGSPLPWHPFIHFFAIIFSSIQT
jgi:hypothetical protein